MMRDNLNTKHLQHQIQVIEDENRLVEERIRRNEIDIHKLAQSLAKDKEAIQTKSKELNNKTQEVKRYEDTLQEIDRQLSSKQADFTTLKEKYNARVGSLTLAERVKPSLVSVEIKNWLSDKRVALDSLRLQIEKEKNSKGDVLAQINTANSELSEQLKTYNSLLASIAQQEKFIQDLNEKNRDLAQRITNTKLVIQQKKESMLQAQKNDLSTQAKNNNKKKEEKQVDALSKHLELLLVTEEESLPTYIHAPKDNHSNKSGMAVGRDSENESVIEQIQPASSNSASPRLFSLKHTPAPSEVADGKGSVKVKRVCYATYPLGTKTNYMFSQATHLLHVGLHFQFEDGSYIEYHFDNKGIHTVKNKEYKGPKTRLGLYFISSDINMTLTQLDETINQEFGTVKYRFDKGHDCWYFVEWFCETHLHFDKAELAGPIGERRQHGNGVRHIAKQLSNLFK